MANRSGVPAPYAIRGSGWAVLGVTASAVVVAAGLAYRCLSQSSHPKPTSPEAMVAMITGTAIAIERLLEIAWTLVEQVTSPDWPRALSDAVRPFVRGLQTAIGAYMAKVKSALDAVTDAAQKDAEAFKKVQQNLASLETALKGLGGPIATEGLQDVSRLVRDTTSLLSSFDVKALGVEDDVVRAASDATTFLSTFSDNPGRRLISIAAGAFLGLLVAGAFGLDIFEAVSNEAPPPTGALFALGVVCTGLVMGLGSSPTHEAVQALQQLKNARKAR